MWCSSPEGLILGDHRPSEGPHQSPIDQGTGNPMPIYSTSLVSFWAQSGSMQRWHLKHFIKLQILDLLIYGFLG